MHFQDIGKGIIGNFGYVAITAGGTIIATKYPEVSSAIKDAAANYKNVIASDRHVLGETSVTNPDGTITVKSTVQFTKTIKPPVTNPEPKE
jgi:hypothetical protein